MKKQLILLGLILLLAFLLRTIALDRLPVGFNQDEAGIGYTAYSIYQTGHDEWGQFLPIDSRAFGDYRAPLYSYLAVPFIAVFGLSEWAVRLPAAIFGTISVLFAYLLLMELFKDRKAALFAAFFVAISSWHISLSRGAFETNLTAMLMPAGFYFFFVGLRKPWLMSVAALFFGLNLFSYFSARLVTPMLILIAIYWKRRELWRLRKHLIAPTLLLSLFGLLVVWSFLSGGNTRPADVSIFNPTDNWAALKDARYESVLLGLPDPIARLFSNKVTFSVSQFVSNYLSYFSLEYLFVHGAGEGIYGMLTDRGVAYLFSIITKATALVALIVAMSRRNEGEDRWPFHKRLLIPTLLFLLAWLLVGALPAALAKGYHAANRNAIALPAWQMVSGIGAAILFETLVKRFPHGRKVIVGLFVIIPFFFLSFFLEDYAFHAPYAYANERKYGMKQAIDYVRDHQNDYQEIVVSKKFSEPQAFVGFYLPIDPKVYQAASPDLLRYEAQGKSFVDQLAEYHVGKFTFKEIPRGLIPEPGVLYLGTPDELQDRPDIISQVPSIDGKPAMIFVARTTP